MATKTIKIGLSDADKAAMTATIKGNALGLIADAYSTSGTYAVGDLVYYNNVLYKCKTAISTAESWTAAHWEATSIEEESKNKLSKGDFDGTTGVGYADVAKSLETSIGIDDQTPFSFTTVGIDSDVETGIQELKKLVCVDVVRNQQFSTSGAVQTLPYENNGITYSLSSGKIILNGTATANSSLTFGGKNIIKDHYYLRKNLKSNGFSMYGTYELNDVSVVKASANDSYLTISVKEGAVVDNYQYDGFAIDITKRYGSNEVVNAIIGNDSSKYVERLLAFDPEILSDTDYDAGTLVPSQSAKLKTVDYNLLEDELSISGTSATGVVEALQHPFVATGKVIGLVATTNAAVPFVELYSGTTKVGYLFLNNTNTNGEKYGYGLSGNADAVIPEGTVIDSIKFYYNGSNGTAGTFTYTKIAIFNYWDGSRIGFESYKEHIIDLPNYEGHGILKVVDGKVVADGDELYPDGNSKKRYNAEISNMKNLTWQEGSSSYSFVRVGTLPAVGKPGKSFITSKPLDSRIINFYIDDAGTFVATYSSGAFASVTELANAFDGISIHYKVATEEDIETAPFNGNPYMDDFGTMSFLDGNGNTIAGLQGCEIFYKANVAGFAESLYAKADGDPDAFALVDDVEGVDAQLKEALGGTLRQLLAATQLLDFDNIAFVDVGSQSISEENGYFSCPISGIKTNGKALCTKYKVVTVYSDFTGGDKVIYVGTGRVIIKDTSFGTDAATFKAAMKNVLLAYEKA